MLSISVISCDFHVRLIDLVVPQDRKMSFVLPQESRGRPGTCLSGYRDELGAGAGTRVQVHQPR